MKPFDYELATQKVLTILDTSGLSLEEKRKVLLELLAKENGLKDIGDKQRANLADEILSGSDVMFLSGSHVDVDRINAQAATGRVKLRDSNGNPVAKANAQALSGYATIIQKPTDGSILETEAGATLDTVTFGKSRSLSPESAAMMVHQHLDVNKPTDTKAFANRDLLAYVDTSKAALRHAQNRTTELLKTSSAATVAHQLAAKNLVNLRNPVARLNALQNKTTSLRKYEAPFHSNFDRDDLTPGEMFAVQTQQEFRDFLDEQRANNVCDIKEARANMKACVRRLAEKYEATLAQVRYVYELYDLDLKSVTRSTEDEWEMCSAWAAAAEFIPHIHELVAEFERRVAQVYWPPSIDSAATFEATLMACSYCWSTMACKSMEEWIAANDGRIIGNLLGVLAKNGHTKVAQWIAKVEPIKDVIDLADFGLAWLDANFSKLEIGHKLAASLCLTDVPDDLEVKAPWPSWSFVIPDGLLASAPRKDGSTESYARVLCNGAEIAYLVSSTGRCVGPISSNQSDSPEAIQRLFKILRSLVKGACLALSDPEQYKKQSLSKNEGSFKKTKRVGGAPELNNARYMLSAPVQVDLRDVVHAVQRGEKRRGGKLTVQFLVRGHWKNQAHGPHLSLRKRKWLQPYWKGDESTRILLRDYIVKDREEPEKDG
jgi:hypothetical protein